MAAIELAWPAHLVELCMSLLVTEHIRRERAAAGDEASDAWSLHSHSSTVSPTDGVHRLPLPDKVELLLLADFLQAAAVTEVAADAVARGVEAEGEAGEWAASLAAIPGHLQPPCLARMPELCWDLTVCGRSARRDAGWPPGLLVDDVWRLAYGHQLVVHGTQTVASNRFRVYGGAATRELTMAPLQLQAFYDDVTAVVAFRDGGAPGAPPPPTSADAFLPMLHAVAVFLRHLPGVLAAKKRPPRRARAVPRRKPNMVPPVAAKSAPERGAAAMRRLVSPIKRAARPRPHAPVAPPGATLCLLGTAIPTSPVAGAGDGSMRRVGGGFGVPVSKPAPTPKRRPTKAKPPSQRSRVATRIQRIVRGFLDRRFAAWLRAQRLKRLPELHFVAATPHLFGVEAFVNPVLVGVAAVCPLLRALDVRGCGAVTPDAVRAIASGCPQLRYLDLSGPNTLCGDDDVAALVTLTSLTSLQLCGWTALEGHGLLALAAGLPPVRTLPAVAPVSMPGRLSHGMAHRLVMGQSELHCPALRSLNLADCVKLKPALVSDLGRLPGLLDLCLFGCLQLDDRALLGLGSPESRMKRLNTAGAYKITSAGTRYLLANNPSLFLYNSPNDFCHLWDHRLADDVAAEFAIS